jgi:hypothetical protein
MTMLHNSSGLTISTGGQNIATPRADTNSYTVPQFNMAVEYGPLTDDFQT